MNFSTLLFDKVVNIELLKYFQVVNGHRYIRLVLEGHGIAENVLLESYVICITQLLIYRERLLLCSYSHAV